MGRCGCGAVAGCTCAFGSSGLIVTGAGSVGNPLVVTPPAVSSAGGINLSGNGTAGSPIVASPPANFSFVETVAAGVRPGSPAVGHVIFDSGDNILRAWDGAAWVVIGGRTPKVRAYTDGSAAPWNSASEALIPFQLTNYEDPSNFFDGSQPTKLTAPIAGLYHITARVNWTPNSSGTRYFSRLMVGGWPSGTEISSAMGVSDPGVPNVVNVSGDWQAAAGDFFGVTGYQASGGTLVYSAHIEAHFVRS